MKDVFVYSFGRSAIGKFGGSLAEVEPGRLGSLVASVVLERCGDGESIKSLVDEVIIGNVLGAGHGMNIARQVGMHAGLGIEVPAFTVNKVCGSGLKSVDLGYQAVALGRARGVLCGGVESMSQCGHVIKGSRWGTKLGAPTIVDLLLHDGLTDVFESCHMGITAENLAKSYSLSREAQDDFAFASQQKAGAATENGDFEGEIIPLEVPGPKRTTVRFEKDEFVRLNVKREDLDRLRPAFDKNGSVTAGNASGINDGAAFIVIGDRELGKR